MAYTTIDDPEAYFQTVIYTGNGSDDRNITLPGDTDMQPDIVWVKGRSDDDSHRFYDSVRGATKYLNTATTGAEGTGADTMQAFQSDGFQVGTDASHNRNTSTYVAWCWKESATAGFDIISYTGNATNRTISHSLSAVPHMMITKNTIDGEHWRCYHHKFASDPQTDYMDFSLNEGLNDNNVVWNDTAPTSSVFSVGTDSGVNGNTDAMIAYLWTSIHGYSKFGSYTGNGNADGTFVYTGFKPAFLLVKRINTSGGNWWIWDNKREGYNAVNDNLYADVTNAEDTSGRGVNLLSNGFKCITTDSGSNGSGNTYIYMAFAEAPFVNSEGVPCNAR